MILAGLMAPELDSCEPRRGVQEPPVQADTRHTSSPIWHLCLRDVAGPVLHQRAAPLQHVASGVGTLDGVPHDVA